MTAIPSPPARDGSTAPDRGSVSGASRRLLPWATASLVLAGGVLVGVTLGTLDVERTRSDTRARATVELAAVQAQLAGVLKEMLVVTEGFVHLIQHQGGLTQAQFDALAAQTIAAHRTLRAISYAPDDVITKLYPVEGNEAALGLDLRTNPEQWRVVEQARRQRTPVLAGPIELVEGGRALVVRAPVTLIERAQPGRDTYWGTVAAVAPVDRVLANGGVTDHPTLNIALRGKDGRGEHGDPIAGDPGVFERDPVTARVVLPGGSWFVAAEPRGGWAAMSPAQSIYFPLAVANALVLATLAGLLVRRHTEVRMRHADLAQESLQRQKAERALRDSEKMLTAIIENAPTKIHVYDLDGRLLMCNRNCEDALGRTRAEVIGHLREEFLPPEIAAEHRRNDLRVIAEGMPMQFEERCPRADGERIELTTKCLLPGDDLETVAVLAMSIDITDRKRAEEAQRLASSVVESTMDAVVVTDPKGTIVAVNPAFAAITGYTLDDTRGRTLRMLKSERHDPEFYRRMWEAITSEGVWQGEIWNRRKNGEIYPAWLAINPVRDDAGRTVNFVAVFSDISAIKRTQADLEHLAHFDPLTDLPNRVLFRDRVQRAIEHAERLGHRTAVLLLDLDGFKLINDSLGHPVGDQLLQRAAQRLAGCVRAEDTVARLGGDEFAVVLSELAEGSDAVEAVQRMLLTIQEPFELAGGNAMVTTSVGVAVFPEDGDNVTELVRNADAAMYEAKNGGRNTYRYYRRKMTDDAQQRLNLENALRLALAQREFEVWFQPQFRLADRTYLGAEALLRWRSPERGLVPPAEFIPVAERSGLIIPLGEQVVEMVAVALRRWLDLGLAPGRLAINVAGPQLERSDFVGTLRRVIESHHLPPSSLEIEITETVIMENLEHGPAVLDAIQALGVTTAIDDFGTGYSSLAYLKQLPIDTIKLDRAFVRDLPDDESDVAISEAVIAMGQRLGFKVVAEGIETDAQLRFLIQAGCDEGQGTLTGEPMPIAVFEKWLSGQQRA